ncbi:MAG: hypothetical protein QOI10_2190 [Solirubrobacterales bacterium]|jgi:hypothetical protein|nr:hypothetical protein [Solirubrobacterales bacterium]
MTDTYVRKLTVRGKSPDPPPDEFVVNFAVTAKQFAAIELRAGDRFGVLSRGKAGTRGARAYALVNETTGAIYPVKA